MPGEKEELKNEETQLVDVEAATAEISEDLFGQGEDDENKSTAEEGKEASGAETVEAPSPQPSETKEAEETSKEVQEIGAPKTWTKEALADWATIPERAKQEILKREEDFFRGISMYKSAAEVGQRYDTVVEPYRAILAAENIDPVNLFQSFAANHYLLSRGTEEQKIQLAANLINGYQIDFMKLADYLGGQAMEVNPELDALRKEIAELKNGFTARETQTQQAMRQSFAAEVNKFADDGQHPLFDEVADDIARFLESGLATSLQDAYDKAVYANPTTRQKELDRLAAEKAAALAEEEKAREAKRRKSMGDHVKVNPSSRNGTVPLGSIDDTLEETMRSISERS